MPPNATGPVAAPSDAGRASPSAVPAPVSCTWSPGSAGPPEPVLGPPRTGHASSLSPAGQTSAHSRADPESRRSADRAIVAPLLPADASDPAPTNPSPTATATLSADARSDCAAAAGT